MLGKHSVIKLTLALKSSARINNVRFFQAQYGKAQQRKCIIILHHI